MLYNSLDISFNNFIWFGCHFINHYCITTVSILFLLFPNCNWWMSFAKTLRAHSYRILLVAVLVTYYSPQLHDNTVEVLIIHRHLTNFHFYSHFGVYLSLSWASLIWCGTCEDKIDLYIRLTIFLLFTLHLPLLLCIFHCVIRVCTSLLSLHFQEIHS